MLRFVNLFLICVVILSRVPLKGECFSCSFKSFYPGSILVITTLTFWKDLYFSYTDFSIPCISWAHSCKTQVILISMCVQDPRLSPAQKAEVEAEVEAEVCVTTFFTIQLSNLKMYNCTNAKKKANWYMY